MGLMKFCSYRVECDFNKIAVNTKYNCLNTDDVSDISFKEAFKLIKDRYKKVGKYWICNNCLIFAKENKINLNRG